MGIWVNAFKVKKVFEIGMNRIFFFFCTRPFAFWTTKAILRDAA